MDDLGPSIRSARRRRELSQKQLAEKLHVSRPAVAHWEKGLSLPKPENLELLRGVLGTDFATEDCGETTVEISADEQVRSSPYVSRSPSIIEMKSQYWRRNEIVVYQGVSAEDPAYDLLIGDVAFNMADETAVFGLLVKGDRLLPHFRDGKLMKLGGEASAKINDLVVVVLGSEPEALRVLFGRLSKRDGDQISFLRGNPENEVQVCLEDRDALFRVSK